MDFTLHSTPRMRDVLREQIRLVGTSLRREGLVVAVILTIWAVVIIIDSFQGAAATWFDSDEWRHLGFLAFILPFAVWRWERPFTPAFLWTLPVDRRLLALAKVFAGWVWLMAAMVGIFLWESVVAALAGIEGAHIFKLVAFPGATAIYLLGSALVLGLRHPFRWVLGTAGLLLFLGILDVGAVDRGRRAVLTPFYWGIIDARIALQQLPDAAQTVITSVIAIAIGVAALWVAVSRHRERRPH